MLCGMQGAGKTTWTAAHSRGCTIRQSYTFQELREDLLRGRRVILDNEHLLSEQRIPLVRWARKYRAEVVLVFFCVSRAACESRVPFAVYDFVAAEKLMRFALQDVLTERWDQIIWIPMYSRKVFG